MAQVTLPGANNQTMTDGQLAVVDFGRPSGVLHLLCSGGAAVVSIVGDVLRTGTSATVLELDSGATTISLADGVPQMITVHAPFADIGIKKISGTGTITAVLATED